jgi:hypothetical protein
MRDTVTGAVLLAFVVVYVVGDMRFGKHVWWFRYTGWALVFAAVAAVAALQGEPVGGTLGGAMAAALALLAWRERRRAAPPRR